MEGVRPWRNTISRIYPAHQGPRWWRDMDIYAIGQARHRLTSEQGATHTVIQMMTCLPASSQWSFVPMLVEVHLFCRTLQSTPAYVGCLCFSWSFICSVFCHCFLKRLMMFMSFNNPWKVICFWTACLPIERGTPVCRNDNMFKYHTQISLFLCPSFVVFFNWSWLSDQPSAKTGTRKCHGKVIKSTGKTLTTSSIECKLV